MIHTKSVHKLQLWLVSVQYVYSESGKRVVGNQLCSRSSTG